MDRQHLGRTQPSEEFESRPTAAPPLAPEARVEPPTLERPSVTERLRQLGLPSPPARPRFSVGDLIGIGATARVFSAVDGDLERPVAIKLLTAGGEGADVAAFLDEARITASLEHPNVLPVHDVEVNSRGQVFFTMKRIEGRSLGAALEASAPGMPLAPLDDINALVSVFIGVCQGLAYAHRRGIVHQDVKPDNIMLGEFGEVLLVDWGSAARVDRPETRLYGTPLYMSPEQARRERSDRRSDVYCVGATLFHALTLRLPTWSDDSEIFWRRKRAGEIDPPSDQERARCPPPLLAIALKALAPDAAARYADAGELLDDLRRYQGGLAVSALRESAIARFRRWHRRHARAFWSWTAAAATILALAAALYWQQLEEIARWGRPQAVTIDGAWRDRWRLVKGGFTAADGALVSASNDACIAMLDERLEGAAAIEYDAEIAAGSPSGDISLIWAPEMPAAGTDPREVDALAAQVGAYDGAFTAISKNGRFVAQTDLRPLPGHRYHVRVEIEDNRMRLAVDGRALCEWIDPFPIEGGYLGLYGQYAGKRFSGLRIYRREAPARLPATAVGDGMARAGLFERAALEYGRVALSRGGTAIGDEARFKLGLCSWQLGLIELRPPAADAPERSWVRDAGWLSPSDPAAARAARARGRRARALEEWAPLRGGRYEPRIRLHELASAYADGDHARVLRETPPLYASADPQLRREIVLQWQEQIAALADPTLVASYLAMHDAAFPTETLVDRAAAETLYRLGRREELLRRYPAQRDLCARSLLDLNRYREVVDGYPDQRWVYDLACFDGGFFDRIDPGNQGLRADALWMEGHPQEVIERLPDLREVVCHALLHSGGGQRVLDDFPDMPMLRAQALCSLGRAAEAAAMDDPAARRTAALALGRPEAVLGDPSATGQELQAARVMAALRARAGGDPGWRARLPECAPGDLGSAYSFTTIVAQMFLVALVDALDRHDPATLDRACDDYLRRWPWMQRQRPAYFARYVLGRIDDEAMRRQPVRIFAEADLRLARAVRADRLGDRPSALAAYRAYLQMPLWSRDEAMEDTVAMFARWRVQDLSR